MVSTPSVADPSLKLPYFCCPLSRNMSVEKEIEDLKEAIEHSPKNVHLRKVLLRKLLLYPEYREEAITEAERILEIAPADIETKEALMHLFLQKGKISAVIVLGEELYDANLLSAKGKVILAKAFYQEKDLDRAQTFYREAIRLDKDLSDEELDRAFRLAAAEEEFEELDNLFLTKPDVNFSDVGGLEDVKREIDLKIIKPLEHAELYASYGKKVGGGILLYGPPGCGKTFLARATAGEINAAFINVTLNDILDMWIGNSEKNLNAIFEEARDNAPCVLFVDEIDALGAKRSDLRQSAGKNVINQFLAELDGIESNNEGVLIIGATNVPWHLDPAFRRPGRFDRIIFVPPPDEENRKEIFQIKLAKKPCGVIDFDKLARASKSFSGADIEAVIDIAIERILENAITTGKPKPIETSDLLAAIKKHPASTLDWFTTAKNYATFANQSGLYDDILTYLKKNKLV